MLYELLTSWFSVYSLSVESSSPLLDLFKAKEWFYTVASIQKRQRMEYQNRWTRADDWIFLLRFSVVLESYRQMRGKICAVQDISSGRGSSEICNEFQKLRAKLPGLWCYIRLLSWQWEQGQGHVMILVYVTYQYPILICHNNPISLRTIFNFFYKSQGQK